MVNARPHILVVDPDPSDCEAARNVLTLFNYEISVATSSEDALKLAKGNSFDAMLIAIELPGSGFTLSQNLRALESYEDVPVAFTTLTEYDYALLMEVQFYGGLFLHRKPFNDSFLLAQLSTMVRIKQLQDELKAKMTELDRLASTDALTGLYNRRFFYQRFEEEIARAGRNASSMCLIYLDIDHFKAINDSYGHLSGDLVLQQVARIMTRMLRRSDVLGRIGGEEFMILLPETAGLQGQRIAERLRKRVEQTPFLCKDIQIEVTVSLGVYFTADPISIGADDLVSRADAALYEAKEGGRNRVIFHSPYQNGAIPTP
jgi:two-component system, cell cycle response regulator